ncbi:MAG: IS66 family transposase [Planctomycetaceae bacterium]|nr:IS66 family transposase [Planctomycetaceae bacterium]
MTADAQALADALALVEQLRQEDQVLRAVLAELEKRVADLVAENRALRDQLDEAQRHAARQAAPFRRRDSQKVPETQRKRPGRPKGHPGVHRVVPAHIDEHVEVPLPACPHCGGAVAGVEPIEQVIEEIPPVRPRVTHPVTYRGQCPHCGAVQSTHPLKTSDATGAAQAQLGPRAQALAATLNKQHGLTMRTTCRVLAQIAGLRLSPGGLAQVVQRVGHTAEAPYEALIVDVRAAPAVFVDETSWYVGGPGPWLWVFTTATETVYRVEPGRGRDVVTATLGPDFTGVLVSDCLASYENVPYRTHKCIAHHLKAIAEARQRPDTADPSYLDLWKLFFQTVIGFWRARPNLSAAEFAERRGHLEAWLDRLLAAERTQPGDVAIRNRIGKRRESILVCLYDPAAEPTNNRAERDLRPAVIARKVSCGNKTEAGKRSFEVLRSVASSCLKRGHDVVSYLAGLLPFGARADPVPAAVE